MSTLTSTLSTLTTMGLDMNWVDHGRRWGHGLDGLETHAGNDCSLGKFVISSAGECSRDAEIHVLAFLFEEVACFWLRDTVRAQKGIHALNGNGMNKKTQKAKRATPNLAKIKVIAILEATNMCVG